MPELDVYINLKPRVEARMALVNLTATGDDDLLSLKEKESMEQVWTHRDEQLRRMQTDILDFEDIEEQLNLNQFTLDDFRAQLLNYLRENEAKLRDAPLRFIRCYRTPNTRRDPRKYQTRGYLLFKADR